MQNISWYLNKNINDVRNIFDEQMLHYEIDVYSCQCGTNKIIIKKAFQDLDKYICSDCENSSFLDATIYSNNYIWYDPIIKILDNDAILSLVPTSCFDKNTKELKSNICLEIPNSLDLSCDKVVHKSKSVYVCQLDIKGNLKQTLQANFDLKSELTEEEINMFESVDEEILINRNNYLKEFKSKILKDFKNYSNHFKSKIVHTTNSLEEFAFFIKYPYLDELNFYKWKNIELIPQDKNIDVVAALNFVSNYRTEKTLKKTIFNNYTKQLSTYDSYDFMYIYSISRFIKDVNILNRMIDLKLKEHIDELINSNDLYEYIKFLSRNFTDKQIERLFISYETEYMFWFIDSISLFSEIYDYIDEFEPSKCKYDVLHEDIVRYHRMKLNKHLFEIDFNYDERYLNACCNIEGYSIKLPINGIELYNWSNILENCLSEYWRLIKNKKAVVYGFEKDNEIKFAVEIRNNKILQAKSKYNYDLKNKEMSLLQGWFKEYFEKDDK